MKLQHIGEGFRAGIDRLPYLVGRRAMKMKLHQFNLYIILAKSIASSNVS